MSGISKRVSGSWVSGDYGIMKTSTDTITTLPADIYANDTTATVGISGNMEQNGTPTPQNPIMPEGTGERTGNLMNRSDEESGYINSQGEVRTPADGWILSDYIPVVPNLTYTFNPNSTGGTSAKHAYYDSNKELISVLLSGEQTFTTPNYATYMRFSYRSNSVNVMLNTGETALPYEPYGIKIPISSASTTTPVYLGEVESTRRIRKKVLDGTETTWTSTILQGRKNFNWKTGSQNPTGAYVLCTHYKSEYAVHEGVCFITSNNVSFIDSRFQSLDDFKNFLADEYAAGHPVTVWYVDANPTTGVVNDPIRKIGNYADTVSGITIPTIAGANTLSVDTTLQPSEVTVNYKGWHTGAVHERDSGQWD